MGYYTNYNLGVHEGNVSVNEILEKIGEKYYGLFYAVDEDGCSVDAVKWYNHEEEMLSLSREFSDLVFVLKGEGEESGDIWHKYFKNGKMQECRATITFDEYDELKLK